MAFEGLLAKNIPTLLRALGPHVPQLLSGIAERFGRDTHEVKEALSAEIAGLRQSHAALLSSAQKQDEATSALREHLRQIERKLDKVAEGQEATVRELVALREQLQPVPGSLRILLVLVLVLALTAAIVGIVPLLLHR